MSQDPITPHLLARIRTAPQPITTETELISFLQNGPVDLSNERVTNQDVEAVVPLILAALDQAHDRGMSRESFAVCCVWAVVEALRDRIFGTTLPIPGAEARGEVKILASLGAAASFAHERDMCPGVFMELAACAWRLPPYAAAANADA